ncbi:MAG: N-6 DNA methylase, partial [Salinivirgaceae bacterium]|nr:N-6 DNA methylase [Salinivirgaceae bacterium]
MYSTLFKLDSSMLHSEAEVETRFLNQLFTDLGFPKEAIIPKKHIPSLIINDGRKQAQKEVDFILKDKYGIPRIIVEAKEPTKNIFDAWGQTASYALSFNSDKPQEQRIKWLLISNGIMTALYPHDSKIPFLTLQLSDFASGMPPYVALRTNIKYEGISNKPKQKLEFNPLPPAELNKLFFVSHNMVWKAEKLAPHDAFFEFCKFIFINIKEDKERQSYGFEVEPYEIPLTSAWLKAQSKTSEHPVRDILFKKLCEELETKVNNKEKKRIFEPNETLELKATTCRALIEMYEKVDLSSIDEDLNGRMFEVFLNAAVRGKDLGQFFTPRSVVDFMTRISLRNVDLNNIPLILDGCCGTAGFLIETMAYMTGQIRNDSRLNERERNKKIKQICNDCLFGVEANKRTSRIARINMYLHGDGGSHIFHGDGLDETPHPTA